MYVYLYRNIYTRTAYADEDEYEEVNRGWREKADARGTAHPSSKRYVHRNSISRSRDNRLLRAKSTIDINPEIDFLRNSRRYHSEMDEDNALTDAYDDNSDEKEEKLKGKTPIEKPPNIFISNTDMIKLELKKENSTTITTTTKKLKKKSKNKKQKITVSTTTTTVKNKKKIQIKKKNVLLFFICFLVES